MLFAVFSSKSVVCSYNIINSEFLACISVSFLYIAKYSIVWIVPHLSVDHLMDICIVSIF